MIPTDFQKEKIKAILRSKLPTAWAGSVRSGKTTAGSMAIILHATQRSDQYIIAGRTYSTVKRNVHRTMDQIRKAWGIPGKFYHSDRMMTIGKSEFLFFGANSETSQDVIQGMTAAGFLLDEVPLMPQSFLMQAIARCSLPNPLMLMTLNKTSPHHWIKRDIIDGGGVQLIESTLDDNPHIGIETRDMYGSLLHGHFKKRMLENEWAAATGCIFQEPMEAPARGHQPGGFIVCDAAQSGTTAALYIVKAPEIPRTPGEVWEVAGEYYHQGTRTFADHVQAINARFPGAKFAWCDPSSPGLIAEFIKAGIMCDSGSNNVIKGIETTIAAIETGRIRVQKGKAPNLLSEIADYVWDEKAQLEGEDKPKKDADHACDALRYFCMAKIPLMSFAPVTMKGAA